MIKKFNFKRLQCLSADYNHLPAAAKLSTTNSNSYNVCNNLNESRFNEQLVKVNTQSVQNRISLCSKAHSFHGIHWDPMIIGGNLFSIDRDSKVSLFCFGTEHHLGSWSEVEIIDMLFSTPTSTGWL